MSKRIKSFLLKYGISLAAMLAVSATYLSMSHWDTLALWERYMALSNAFALPGLLMIFSGLMVFVSNAGALDGVTFLVSQAFLFLIPGGRYRRQTYGDYVTARREKKVKGYGYMLICGVLFVAVSVVFSMLYASAK